jgi:hypothetical protein
MGSDQRHPPRWCNWRSFNQIASSLGRLMEIDWNSLFTGFFGMVRVKIACKDRSKVPGKRMFEMMNKLFLIQFKVEGLRTWVRGHLVMMVGIMKIKVLRMTVSLRRWTLKMIILVRSLLWKI